MPSAVPSPTDRADRVRLAPTWGGRFFAFGYWYFAPATRVWGAGG